MATNQGGRVKQGRFEASSAVALFRLCKMPPLLFFFWLSFLLFFCFFFPIRGGKRDKVELQGQRPEILSGLIRVG